MQYLIKNCQKIFDNTAAGNEGSDYGGKIHYQGTATGTSNISVNLKVTDYAYFTMWYKGGDNIGVQVKTIGGTTYPASPVQAGSTYSTNTPEGFISIDASANPSPLNNDNNVIIKIDNSGGSAIAIGQWTLIVTGVSGGKYDIWALDSYYCDFIDYNTDMTVCAPGTCKKVITVGSYTTKTSWIDVLGNTQYIPGESLGSASTFSSSGPTRDNREKPEIIAPGQMIGSTLSKDVSFPLYYILPDGEHLVMAGTSMATPHVVGLVVLMLQRNNSLDVDIVRNALTSTAVGGTWNKKSGYGRINGVAAFESIPGAPLPTSLAVAEAHTYPNPARGNYVNFVYSVNADCNANINFYNLAGEMVSTTTNFSTNGLNKYSYDVSRIATGVYFCQVVIYGSDARSKVMKVAIIK